MSTLHLSVAAGDAGPVLVLAGEADVTTARQLRDAIGAQLDSGTLYLTIDAAELRFADSMTIGILTGTARALRELGGNLVLLLPQETVLRTLTLLGADRVITIQAAADMAQTASTNGDGLELAQVVDNQAERAGRPTGGTRPGPQPRWR